MSPLKVLITGGSGSLGSYLNEVLSKEFEILTTFYSQKEICGKFPSKRLDITDYNELSNIFKEFEPDFVVHTAAVSNQKKAEDLSEEAVRKINVEAVENIASFCSESQSKLIFLSTDLVYDGDQGSLLNETAKLNPVSLYAETKLEAESRILENAKDYVILRTALLYGFVNNPSDNYFHYMYEKLKNEKPVKLFYDQFRTPLWLRDAARMISEIINTQDLQGVYNFGGRERLSRWDMGEILCEETGFNKDLLLKTSMYGIKQMPKVADVSMNTDKLSAYGIKANKYKDCVDKIIKENQ